MLSFAVNFTTSQSCCGNVRDATTCTNITCNVPLFTSTPCSSPRLECCASPNLSVIESCSETSCLFSNDTFNIEDGVILQCSSESCASKTVDTPPTITSSIRNYVQQQLNKTYEWTRNTFLGRCNRTCPLRKSKTCPHIKINETLERLNKSCEFKPQTKDCRCQSPRRTKSKRTDFDDKHRESHKKSTQCPPTSSCRHIDLVDEVCDRCRHLVDTSPATKSSNIIDQLCEACRSIYNVIASDSNMAIKFCKHEDIDDKLCKHCRKIINSAPCPPVMSCKHVEVFNKLCQNCKSIIETASCLKISSCLPNKVKDSLCKHCIDIIESAPSNSNKSSELSDVFNDLCEHCKLFILDFASRLPKNKQSCRIEDKLCKKCSAILDSSPNSSILSCKSSIAEKLCKPCKHMLESAPCKPNKPSTFLEQLHEKYKYILNSISCQATKPCRHTDVEDKLCKQCKRVVDAVPYPPKSCKHIDVFNDLCKYCKYIIKSAPCPAIKSCKQINVEDKFCKHCKNIIGSNPDQSTNKCKFCGVINRERSKNIKSVSCQCEKDKKHNHTCNSIPCCSSQACGKSSNLDLSCPDKIVRNSCGSSTYTSKSDESYSPALTNSSNESSYHNVSCSTDPACSITLCKAINKTSDSNPSISSIKTSKPNEKPGHSEPQKVVKVIKQEKKSSYPASTCLCKSNKCIDKSCNPTLLTSGEKNKPMDETQNSNSTKPCKQVDDTSNSNELRTTKLCKSSMNACKHEDDQHLPCVNIKPREKEKLNFCGDRISEPTLFQSLKIWKRIDKPCDHCFVIEPPACQTVKNYQKVSKTSELEPLQTPSDPCLVIDPPTSQTGELYPKVSKEHKPDNIEEPSDTCKILEPSCALVEPCNFADETSLCKSVDSTSESKSCEIIDNACEPILCECTDNSCEPISRLFIEQACDAASFQSIKLNNLVDKTCDPCNSQEPTLCQSKKPNKLICFQDPEKEESCRTEKEVKLKELFFNDHSAGPAGCSSADLWKCLKCSRALESHSAATVTNECPMYETIKQAAKSTSFDVNKDSCCRSSGQESPGGSCASARARYYQNKLLATLQILQNKEETVRIQAESLAVAESRIAALTKRHTDLRRDVERKEKEIQNLRRTIREYKPCKVEKCDISITAERELDDQKNIVTSLQNNLDVIEDLYRESFYETVKQENLIEMLRKSNLDIRLMEKDKSDRITKLHNVINSQQWSLDRCQDMAIEVENLKMEISNFINSSNNDSGMWEDSVVEDLNEDLQDISTQLLRLRDLLNEDCTCGLAEENRRLRSNNESLENEISSLRSKNCALEASLKHRNASLEQQYQEKLEEKDRELSCIREKLDCVKQNGREKSSCLDILTKQIELAKAQLEEKTSELCCMQKQSRYYEDTINIMKEEICKTEQIHKENAALRDELCCVSRRAARVQRRAADVEAELARARAHWETVEAAYREKIANATELERQLDEAHARGADLCAEAGRVVRAVHCWAARMKDVHREQAKQIKQKECKLRCLQKELDKRNAESYSTVREQREQCCSPRPSTSYVTNEASLSKSVRIHEDSCPRSQTCTRQRWESAGGSSGSEIASCFTPPVALRKRTCMKKPAIAASVSGLPVSPGEEMFARMESLSAALADGYKRWTRRTH